MALHTFGSSLAYDPAVRRGIAGATGKATDMYSRAPVDTYDLAGNPAPLITNASGYFEGFKTEDIHDVLEITFDHITMPAVALEVINGASLALAELDRLSISNLGIDTDGTPYFSLGNTAAHMHQDTDGTPYFTSA